jgi:hypothetical protein
VITQSHLTNVGGSLTMVQSIRGITMISTERSIIDEIRDDLQLDDYYRRFEKNKLLNELDFCDDLIETDYVFESYYD